MQCADNILLKHNSGIVCPQCIPHVPQRSFQTSLEELERRACGTLNSSVIKQPPVK